MSAYPIGSGADTTGMVWIRLLGDIFDLPIRQEGGARRCPGGERETLDE
jgi:hypothetical protein